MNTEEGNIEKRGWHGGGWGVGARMVGGGKNNELNMVC